MTWPHLTLIAGTARREVFLGDYLSPEAAERAAERANRWVKDLRHARVDGSTFRDRFTYRGDSLWWFAELYLHKLQAVLAWHARLEAIAALVEREAPARVVAGPAVEPRDRHLLHAALGARGIATEGTGLLRARRRGSPARHLQGEFLTWSARAARRWHGQATPPRGRIAAFVHTAFWRRRSAGDPGDEGYIGPVLGALADLAGSPSALIGLGPASNFRARQWWHGVRELWRPARTTQIVPIESLADAAAITSSLAVWAARDANLRALAGSPDVRAHALIDGVDLWPLVLAELDGVTRLQFPWSARAMDEAGAALDRLEPSVAITYAEAGGWGRALVLEARRRAIPSAGLQHGFIYRHWLNYLHEADEMVPSRENVADRGYPRPTRTLVFDRYAETHLLERGHFPPQSVTVTGSAGRDALAEQVAAADAPARERVREALGVRPGERLALLVTKFTQVARAVPTLVEALLRTPGIRLVVLPHPAETAQPYVEATRGLPNATIAPASIDLAGLLSVANVLVTVNSTVALDGLALGLPAIVVNEPGNLTPFVRAGVMAGASTPDVLAASLRSLAAPSEAREALVARARAFAARFGIEPSGRAAAATAEAIVEVARLVPRPTGHRTV